MQSVKLFDKSTLLNYYTPRVGERKIGDTIIIPENQNWSNWLSNQSAQFVILGIPEDIGVRANGGIGGTFTAWESFLKAFLNIQHNDFFKGKNMVLLGAFDFEEMMLSVNESQSNAEFIEKVLIIDDLVAPVISAIINARKIPIVIGGGHNNAFPILKGLSQAKNEMVNAINMDAHADFRALEGRHSGNGFSYAYANKYLKNYMAFGLHQAYNNEDIIKVLNSNPDLKAIWYETIYLKNELTFEAALSQSIAFVNQLYFGVELDLDCIQDTLSSAQTPLGFSRQAACQYLYQTGLHPKSAYLHLTEAVAKRSDGLEYPMIGKLLSYLVQAFIKGKLDKKR